MSIQGKKIAMIKHACDVAKSVISNVKTNFNNPFLLQLGLFHIRHQSSFRMHQLQSTPADRFNDDGSLKPEDVAGKVVVAAGGGNPEKVRVMLEDVGFKVEGL